MIWADAILCIAASDSITVFHVNGEVNVLLQLLSVSLFASPTAPVFNPTP